MGEAEVALGLAAGAADAGRSAIRRRLAGDATFALMDIDEALRGIVDRVEALDGSLQVASPPGRGTTVTAQLPFVADERT